MKNIKTTVAPDEIKPEDYLLFRSSVSGLLYENELADGDVSEVLCKHCMKGVKRNRKDSEYEFLKRMFLFFCDHECFNVASTEQ